MRSRVRSPSAPPSSDRSFGLPLPPRQELWQPRDVNRERTDRPGRIRMNKRLLAFLAILGVLGFLAICAGIALSVFGGYPSGSLPSKILLEADFERPIEEYMSDQPITKAFGGEEPTTRDVIDALDRAAGDSRVVGLVARLGAVPMGLAQIQEIRDAITR